MLLLNKSAHIVVTKEVVCSVVVLTLPPTSKVSQIAATLLTRTCFLQLAL